MKEFKKLNKKNIEEALNCYKKMIEKMDSSYKAKNPYELFKHIKRDKTGTGPYPKTTLYESANRIMTDLVILFGVKRLLNEKEAPFKDFKEYQVEYGIDNINENDITVKTKNDKILLRGEAFNVATSYFGKKKRDSLKKLKKNKKEKEIILLLYNKEANLKKEALDLEKDAGVYHCQVEEKLILEWLKN